MYRCILAIHIARMDDNRGSTAGFDWTPEGTIRDPGSAQKGGRRTPTKPAKKKVQPASMSGGWQLRAAKNGKRWRKSLQAQ